MSNHPCEKRTKFGQDLFNIIFKVSIYTYNPPNNLLGLSWDKTDHVIQNRTMVIRRYPPLDLISVGIEAAKTFVSPIVAPIFILNK